MKKIISYFLSGIVLCTALLVTPVSAAEAVSYTHLKKAEEEKAAKKRAEKSAEGKETGDYTLSVTGNDVKSMTQSLVACLLYTSTKYSESLRSGEPDWSMIPSAGKSSKSQAEFVSEIKELAQRAANKMCIRDRYITDMEQFHK